MDEPLDIRELTEANIAELAALTRRPESSLRQELLHAHNVGRKVFMLVNNPLLRPRKRTRLSIREDCDYSAHWSEVTGWTYICRIHNKPSWHSITEFPSAPCIAIEPKPDDV